MAVQMLGYDMQEWAKQGVLGHLDDLAAHEGWEKVIPKPLQAFSMYDCH